MRDNPVRMAESREGLVMPDEFEEFIRQRSTRSLPHLEILNCFSGSSDWFYLLHLRDPISQAELLYPISTLWVQEYRLRRYSRNLNRARKTAAKILDFRSFSGLEGD